jgi:DnaJ-class molecular chaperone
VLGGKVKAPTPTGAVMLTVPKGANTGTVLRLKGKGLAKAQGGHGDQYVTLKVVLPDKPDPELEEFVTRWSKAHAYDPRRAMEV